MNRAGVLIVLACVFPVATLAKDPPADDRLVLSAPRPSARAQSSVAPQPASGQAVLNLNEVLQEALRQNPGVQSAWHTVQAEQRRVPQARSLPDPRVGVGWMGNATPFSVQKGDPSSYRSLQAMQEIPFPGKLGLRGEIASKEADAARWEYEAARRRVAADAKAAYYDYWFYDKAIQTTQKNKDLLAKLSQISEARYRVGKGIQQDILRSQVETSLLLQRLTVLEQQKKTAQARLNTLMSRAPDAPLAPPTDIQQAGLTYSLQELYSLARQNDPDLQREQQMIERNRLAVTLAEKDYRPDLSVGYMYEQRPAMPDMHGLTFTINVPVFYRTKQREEVREATEERLATERRRDNRQNELYFELQQQYLAAKASAELLQLYSQGVVPQSSLALESSMSSYQVGSADFLTVIGNFSTVLNYQIDYYRELANFQTALARMEPLVGIDLTSQAAQK